MIRFLLSSVVLFVLSGCLSSSADSQDNSLEVNGQTIVVPSEVDGQLVPPDPGSEGEETLLGIDSNDNGVRDDVERYIYARFQGFENANKEQAIAMQYGRATQHIMKFGAEKAFDSEKLMSKTRECAHYFRRNFMSREEARIHDIFDSSFKDITFNTKERLEVYFEYNAALSGHAFAVNMFPSLETCEVDITKIEN